MLVVIEKPLKDGKVVSELKKEWTSDTEYQNSLKLVKLDHEIVVNFNLYFRMTAGISQTSETFFVSESTNVGLLSDQVSQQTNPQHSKESKKKKKKRLEHF